MKKFLRWPTWVIVGLFIIAAFIPTSTLFHSTKATMAHAMGSTTSPTISLSASIVHPGETVTVTGQGFAIADRVTITIDSSYYAIGTLSCDSNGNCSGSAIIPNNSIVQGPHQVTGAGTSGLVAQTPVTVLPRIFTTPPAGGPGTAIQLNGVAFATNETVQVYWKANQNISEGTATTDYSGSFSLNLNAPTAIAAGTYSIIVVRSNQTPTVVGARFQIRKPKMVSTAGIHNNQAVHAQLSGFQAFESVVINWNANGGQTITTLHMDATGSTDAYFAPPFAPKGAYTLTAQGSSSGLSVAASLNIGPGILLTLNTANAGGTISASGGGFTPGETVNVYFQNTINGVTSATIDALGSFTVPLTVPVTHENDVLYYVYAVNTTGTEKTRAEFFYMVPSLQSACCLTYDSPFTITGQGFTAQETANIYWEFGQLNPLKLGIATAASDGSFTFTFTAPSSPHVVPYSPYPAGVDIVAIGNISKSKATDIEYEYPAIFTNTTYGSIGTKVKVTGGAFDSTETVTISLQGIQVAVITTLSNGKFTATFVIPSGVTLGGSVYSLAVVGSSSGLHLYAYFKVTLPLKITPTTGPSGTIITVAGNSYTPATQVLLYWCDPATCYGYGNYLTSVTTTSTGTFNTAITAPANLVSGHTYYIFAEYIYPNPVAQAAFIAQ
ncbi:MAG TPA: hypothetical protein VEU97_14890 [Ktedonobacteraceae bacterium]|nr:hypothetical protein [Ktedonobacteraceae bacterium]